MKTLIRNVQQIKQALDYIGLIWNKISLTDIDAALEYAARFVIYFEVKRMGNTIQGGQDDFLKNHVNNWVKAGLYDIYEYKKNPTNGIVLPGEVKRLTKRAIAVQVEFDGDKYGDDELIVLKDCLVTRQYLGVIENGEILSKWEDISNPVTVEEFLDGLIDAWDMSRMKIK